MKDKFNKLARHILPASLVRKIQVGIHGIAAADAHAAWEFKRTFFWSAVRALDFNGIDGDYCEFGCHTAMTFRLAFDQFNQRTIKRHLWAFDSFKGLPAAVNSLDNHPSWIEGTMSTEEYTFHKTCKEHGIPRTAYSVVNGFYDDTLNNPNLTLPTNIAFVYIDCDLYSSTKTVLEFLTPRLKHGMIIAFDDYFCMSSDQLSGERRAMLEILCSDKNWNFIRYRDFGWAGASFIVECAHMV